MSSNDKKEALKSYLLNKTLDKPIFVQISSFYE